jgi:hypothetical protein
MTESAKPDAALSDEELALEQVIELPERDALTVINLLPLPVPITPTPAPADIVDNQTPPVA